MIYLTGNFSLKVKSFPRLGSTALTTSRSGQVKFKSARLHSARCGFTLMEMLVVLAIIGMLLGISIPFTTGFGKGLRLKTAARAILGTLRVARSNAITYREKYVVVFDIENSQYWIESLSEEIFERKSRLPSSIKFKTQGEVVIDPITFEGDRVVFCPTGAIEGSSGSITISDKEGNSKTISIIGSTGKISID